ncbi:MAG: ERAP1-like C-terminal domain-containing protein [Candidatus Omnitrophica bacterium]|nr:ERAP1-like C-terminal domain-containing protein [Candidatus Omnitrophota bacterium]
MTARHRRVALPAGKNWLKANPEQSGFYRVVYSQELFHRLVGAAASGQLPAVDTLGFLDDAFALARAGAARTSSVLELLSNCRHQNDYNFWLEAGMILAAGEEMLDVSMHPAFFAFCRDLLMPLRSQLGWERRPSDGHLDHLLRSLVMGRLGHWGDQETLSQAQRRFNEFVAGGQLDPNLRGAVYALIAEQGGQKQCEQLLALYRKSQLQEEKMRLLRALTRFRVPRLIGQILSWSLTSEVRSQDAFAVLAGFGSNPAARAQNWRFVKSEFRTLTQRYPGGSVTLLGRILEGAAASFITEDELKDAETFFRKHPLAGTERTIRQTLEFIRANIRWAKRDQQDVSAWLSR